MGTNGYTLYWGDLHSHCSISYGYGTYERALECAMEQLDFCSVTGHAFWPDMPTDRSRYAQIIDYHTEGFARCARNWPNVRKMAARYDRPGRFVPFLSYEWHSLESGDHNVYYRELAGGLIDGRHLDELETRLHAQGRTFLLMPHHIGYGPGRRGINWAHFNEQRSPLVEIFSLHGCSESDDAPFPLYHTMGPRDMQGTASFGLQQGHRFGLVGGTDHHGGFPGSYGDGLVGIWAKELTRESLWDALLARRTCAVSGDKISALFTVNGAMPGEEIAAAGERELDVHVVGQDAIEFVDILKNERVVRRIPAPRIGTSAPTVAAPLTSARDKAPSPGSKQDVSSEWKIRIEWGWGSRTTRAEIEGAVQLQSGELVDVTPCFRGETILSPDDDAPGSEDVPHRLIARDARSCAWQSKCWANPSPRQPETQALILTVRMEPAAELVITMNEWRVRVPLARLIQGSLSENFRGWLSESVRIHRAVPQSDYTVRERMVDDPEGETDVYRMRVAQRNGQWAWTSPVWVSR